MGELTAKTFPKPDYTPKPGVYMVQKDDVNQGRVSVGHKSIMRGTPDEYPGIVMNGILGASGFRSRRSNKLNPSLFRHIRFPRPPSLALDEMMFWT